MKPLKAKQVPQELQPPGKRSWGWGNVRQSKQLKALGSLSTLSKNVL